MNALTSIIPWPKGIKPGDLLSERDISDIIDQRIPPSLLDRAASATTGVLTSAHDEVKTQDAIISEAQERRRQAMIVIAAFEPAQKHLVDGIDQPNPLPAPKPRAKGRG